MTTTRLTTTERIRNLETILRQTDELLTQALRRVSDLETTITNYPKRMADVVANQLQVVVAMEVQKVFDEVLRDTIREEAVKAVDAERQRVENAKLLAPYWHSYIPNDNVYMYPSAKVEEMLSPITPKKRPPTKKAPRRTNAKITPIEPVKDYDKWQSRSI